MTAFAAWRAGKDRRDEVAESGFRLDLQGLRALAVLMVVAYHADFGLRGGYIGVDVFFVISGFVIAKTLANELDTTGRVDLRRFYSKRIRRLLPALALVSVVTLLASIPIVGFGVQNWVANTARAATLFHANWFLFESGGGYFDPQDELNPFLHMWSLAVEEQFYFVLPGTLAVLWWSSRRSPRRAAAVVLSAMALVSLLLSWSLTYDVGPVAERVPAASRFAFYLSITRAWEFLAGVALAIWPLARSGAASARNVVWVVGALAILGSSVVFDDSTPFPGVAAAAPVLGAVLLIAAGGGTFGARLLQWRPVTWIGDISYSWYLWHWPAIVLTGQALPTNDLAPKLAAVLSIVPAWLSYQYVEQPVRLRLPGGWRMTLAIATASLLLPLGLAVGVQAGARTNWGQEVPAETVTRTDAYESGCLIEEGYAPWSPEDCTWTGSGSDGSVFLVGDSHANAMADSVRNASLASGFAFKTWTKTGCPFSMARRPDTNECGRWQGTALETVIDNDPSLVVIANRSTVATLSPVGEQSGPVAAGDGRVPATQSEALDIWEDGLRTMLAALQAADIPVLIVTTVPEYEVDGPALRSLLHPDGYPTELSKAEVGLRRSGTVAVESKLAGEHSSVSLLDPVPVFCLDGCSPVRDGQWLYRDDDHLSLLGAALLEPVLAEAVLAATTGRAK